MSSGIEVNGNWFSPARPVTIGREADADVSFFDPRVSRRHATLRHDRGAWQLSDDGSARGTFVDGHRIERMTVDRAIEARLGHPSDGATLRLRPDGAPGPKGWSTGADGTGAGEVERPTAPVVTGEAPTWLRIGRDTDNDIVLLDLLVSRHHAEIRLTGPRRWELVDLDSANGTFVDGARTVRTALTDGQRITVGRTQMRFAQGRLEPWPAATDERGVALRASGVTVVLPNGRRLLDDVSFDVPSGSLCAVLGPTGSGKSTLLKALTGFRPPDAGSVFLDGRDLYAEFDELRRTIGYVPQDDILHTTLSVRRALEFGAELRFPADVTPQERGARVDEVLAELGLTAHAGTVIERLSGGQRKRTSVALELLTRPAMLFLDEPTSGLDPGYEKAVMTLLRELADGGRAVVVVTHSMQSLDRCHQVLFLAPGGVPAFVGTSAAALRHFGRTDFADVFSDLEDSAAAPKRFGPTSAHAPGAPPKPDVKPPPPPLPWGRQVSVLVRRQVAVLLSDRRNLAFLAAAALVPAVLIVALFGGDALARTAGGGGHAARTLLSALAVSAAAIGAANTLREVVKEQGVYARERAGGLDPVAYLVAKLVVFGALTALQCLVLVVIATARAGGPTRAVGPFPPLLELTAVVALTGVSAAALGLAISAVVSNSEKAMALIAVIFIVQWLFSGAAVDLHGKPVVEQLAYVTSSNWGLAAAGSSIDLRPIDDACAAAARGAAVIGPPCDARWAHDLVHLATSVVALATLTLAFSVLALVAVTRKEPIRTPTVLTPLGTRLRASVTAAVAGARAPRRGS